MENDDLLTSLQRSDIFIEALINHTFYVILEVDQNDLMDMLHIRMASYQIAKH